MKPFSEACERNRGAILEVLRTAFAGATRVLEVGSGTGQHAAHFAAALPYLTWQSADLPEHHAGIRAWLDEAGLSNTPPPLALDVHTFAWPEAAFDAAFSANTAHILSWPGVEKMLAGVARALRPSGCFALYGPFNAGGTYTAESNRAFDAWLRGRDPESGLRDLEAVEAAARGFGLEPCGNHPMPANNRLLLWRKAADAG